MKIAYFLGILRTRMEMSQSILKTIPRWPGTIFNKSKISVKTFYLWKHFFCNLFLVNFFNTHANMITRNMTKFHYSLTQGCAVRSLKNLLYGTARLVSSKSSIFLRGMSDSIRYPGKFYLIYTVEDIFVW